jgi:hypothetical protein
MDPWFRMLDENEDVFISALKQDLNKPVQVIFFLLVETVCILLRQGSDVSFFYPEKTVFIVSTTKEIFEIFKIQPRFLVISLVYI